MKTIVDHDWSDNARAEVQAFLDATPAACYLQQPDWPDLLPPSRRFRHMFLRVYQGGELCGTAVARLSPIMAGYRLAFLRRGPVVQSPNDLASVTRAVANALRQHRVASLVLNPRWGGAERARAIEALEGADARMLPQNEQSLHSATLLVDLEGGPDAILARMKQRGRRQIRQAEKMGLEVHEISSEEEAEALTPLVDGFYTARGLGRENLPAMAQQFQMTRRRGAILAGTLDGRPICAHTMIPDGDRAFWLMMAARDEPEKLPKNYLLIWHALRIAAAQGFRVYDMGGAPSMYLHDQNAAAGMAARNQFKTAFAPRQEELTPMMVLPVIPVAHALLFNARRGLRTLKRRAGDKA
ncbi:MAG: peptidoglycan bridge formation glycyltransferase FemA/FemB family protein [Maritimibacter sp.]|nr:peptidoglycan bridge formation glycyltransferase FemA/FemB family protein [Maritimibacter sp.]